MENEKPLLTLETFTALRTQTTADRLGARTTEELLASAILILDGCLREIAAQQECKLEQRDPWHTFFREIRGAQENDPPSAIAIVRFPSYMPDGVMEGLRVSLVARGFVVVRQAFHVYAILQHDFSKPGVSRGDLAPATNLHRQLCADHDGDALWFRDAAPPPTVDPAGALARILDTAGSLCDVTTRALARLETKKSERAGAQGLATVSPIVDDDDDDDADDLHPLERDSE